MFRERALHTFLTSKCSGDELASRICFDLNVRVKRKLKAHFANVACSQTLIPGTRSALEHLSKYFLLGIISNCSILSKDTLKLLGVEHFFTWKLYSFEVGSAKPDLSIFRQARTLAHKQSPTCFHIGDSYVHDYVPASKVGFSPILICKDHTSKAVTTISSVAELPRYLEG